MELSKTKTSQYASLSLAKHRRKQGLFLVEGTKSVADTLDSFSLEALLATSAWIESNPSLCVKAGGKLYSAKDSDLKKISTLSTPPRVIAVYHIPEYGERPSLKKDSLNLVLDTVQDPGNLGTIIRTADWFGIHTVFASRETADVYNSKCIQACMGSITRVRVVYCDLAELLSEAGGIPVYGLQLDGKDIYRSTLGNTGVIIMGNEGQGISGEIRKYVNSPLLIPPYDDNSHGESLNVAIATAITLALFRNRR